MPFLEIEAKILEIDRNAVESNLLSLGAEKIFDGDLVSFSYLAPNGKRVRMRTFNGTQTFLTYKERTGNAGEFSTEELEFETEVQDPNLMHEILIRTGFECVAKIPKHRTSYKLGETRYEIDDYGKVPVLLEFESPNEDILIAAVEKLGFNKDQLFLGGTRAVEKHYNIDLNTL